MKSTSAVEKGNKPHQQAPKQTAHSSNLSAEALYKKLKESLDRTGNINHPETKKIEKSYMMTLSIDQLHLYNDMKLKALLPDGSPKKRTCGTCGRKESSDQKAYRLKYQEIAETVNAASGGGLSREKSDKEVDPYSLFYQWVFGTGKAVRNFDENSKMGNQFLNIEEIYYGIEKLVDSYIDKGTRTRDVSRNNPEKFNTGNQWLDDKTYMADALSNIITNPTSTFHGSFNATARIIKVDHGNLVDTYTVRVTCTDHMGATSGTRNPPVKGKYSGKATIPNNYYGPNGYMRTIQVNYNLTTKIHKAAISRQVSNLFK
ncbi:hypothetical protein LF887_01810 [Chryseobacterium sp. MEBOG06]|uniref:hypothetical protein n=1 Tax=Chryseobacterium sp. MEBOG06 TaxID=2879938 RepID=UPI001F42608A|nr:hypothetical protein [Chryseobacterium sp. MEBOG06]UKB84411.1 hypothetical protein LF887_01810 [Chryseobacterium sp. MEBOG06]